MSRDIKGIWQNITCKHSDRNGVVVLGLACGHRCVIRRDVPQYNGLLFDDSQTSCFCTQCDLSTLPSYPPLTPPKGGWPQPEKPQDAGDEWKSEET